MVRIPINGPPTHPGEMLLEEFVKPLKMTQSDLAEKLGVSYPRVNELIHEKRGITPDTALRLEKLFGMDAQFWLNLQLTCGELVKKCPLPQPHVDPWLLCDTPAGQQRSWP